MEEIEFSIYRLPSSGVCEKTTDEYNIQPGSAQAVF